MGELEPGQAQGLRAEEEICRVDRGMAHDELQARLGDHRRQRMRPHARGITLVVLEVDELRVALLGHEDLALLPHTGVEDAGYCYLECGDQGLLGLDRDAPLEQPLTGPDDRKSVVSGKSVSFRVALGGRRIIKKKK